MARLEDVMDPDVLRLVESARDTMSNVDKQLEAAGPVTFADHGTVEDIAACFGALVDAVCAVALALERARVGSDPFG